MIILQAPQQRKSGAEFFSNEAALLPAKVGLQGRRGVNPVLEMDAHEGAGRATVAVAELRPIAPTSAIPLKIEVPGMTEGLYLPLPHHNPVSVIDPHVSGLASSPLYRPRARTSLGTCLR
jgi:hypothetical protein